MIHLAPAPGSPVAAGPEPADIALADLDADGVLDLIIANPETSFITILRGVALLRNTGTGFEPFPASPIAIAEATDVAMGDIDGDGTADVAIGPWAGRDVTILSGEHFIQTTLRVGRRPIGLAIADLTGDGKGAHRRKRPRRLHRSRPSKIPPFLRGC